MKRQFDMPLFDSVRGFLNDRAVVDQTARRDQHAIQKQRVVRRHDQVAMRPAATERVGADADGPNTFSRWMTPAIDHAPADPARGLDATVSQYDSVS
jgi:hypothetical protein